MTEEQMADLISKLQKELETIKEQNKKLLIVQNEHDKYFEILNSKINQLLDRR